MSSRSFKYQLFEEGFPIMVILEGEAIFDLVESRLEQWGFAPMNKDQGDLPGGFFELTISQASLQVGKQLESHSFENNHLGQEYVLRKSNYDVYIYDRLSMLVFSKESAQWQLGLMLTGAAREIVQEKFDKIFSRSLGLVFEERFNVTSFWGQVSGRTITLGTQYLLQEAGIIQYDAQSEHILFRGKKYQFLHFDGIVKFVDQVDHRRTLTKEESFASLLNMLVPLHYRGWSQTARETILELISFFKIEERSYEPGPGIKAQEEAS
jgi:hypothetical protein